MAEMKEFKSNNPSIDAKVITIEGETVEVKGRYILSAKKSSEIMDWMGSYERDEAKKPVKDKRLSGTLKIAASELEYLYDKDADWFLENLDVSTMTDMITYASEVVGGVLKK